MITACKEIDSQAGDLTHLEWLGLLLEREFSRRRDKRLVARLRYAKLRHQACVEDVDYHAPRGLERSLLIKLGQTSWLDDHDNLLICGPAGIGKSWISSAIAHQA
jgi:DNA replication protein DnaC